MPISLKCECGHRMAIAEDRAGERVRCPKCREIITVPSKRKTRARNRSDVCSHCGGPIDTEGEICTECAVALVKNVEHKAAKEDVVAQAQLGQFVFIVGGLCLLVLTGIEFVGTYYQVNGFGATAPSGAPDGPTLLMGFNWRFLFFVGMLSYLLTMGVIPTAETRFSIGALLFFAGLAIWAADARHVRLETTWGSGVFRSPFVVSLAGLWLIIALLFFCKVPTLGRNLVSYAGDVRTYQYFLIDHRTRIIDLIGLGFAIGFFGSFQISSPKARPAPVAAAENVVQPPAPARPVAAPALAPVAAKPEPQPAWPTPPGTKEIVGSSGLWRIALPPSTKVETQIVTATVTSKFPMVVKDVRRIFHEIPNEVIRGWITFEVTETTWADEAKNWSLEELLAKDWETEQLITNPDKVTHHAPYRLGELDGAEWSGWGAGRMFRVVAVALPDRTKTIRLTVRSLEDNLAQLREMSDSFAIVPKKQP